MAQTETTSADKQWASAKPVPFLITKLIVYGPAKRRGGILFFATGRVALCSSLGILYPTQPPFFICMHILYVDESGDGGSVLGSSRYLVLCGAAMHEGQWRKLTKQLDDIQLNNFPTSGTFLEFHASEMRTGARSFRGLPRPARNQAIQEVYRVISRTPGLSLFAAVVDKPAFVAKYQGRVDVYRGAFEGLTTMFDYFLKRKQKQSQRVERGIVVFDEARPSLSRRNSPASCRISSWWHSLELVGLHYRNCFFL